MDATQELQHWPLGPEQRPLAESGNSGHSHFVTARSASPINPVRLQQALTSVSARHQALRFAYREVHGYRGLRQVGQHTEVALAALVETGQAGQRRQPDIAAGQTIAAVITEDGAGTSLALNIAALAADQASMALLWRELKAAYDGQPLEDEVFQYSQYVEWRLDLDADPDAAQGRAYWNAYLQQHAGAVPVQLCYRQPAPGPESPTHHGAVQTSLDTAVLARLDTLAQTQGASLETALQLAWWLLLARLQGSAHIAAGWLHDCRRDYEVMQRAVGRFEKLMPVALQLGAGQSFNSLLAGLSATLEAHRGAQEYCPPDRQSAAIFTYRDAAPDLGDWQLDAVAVPGAPAELALTITGAGAALHSDQRHYRQHDVAVLLTQYTALLAAIVQQPDSDALGIALPAAAAIEGESIEHGPALLGERIAQWSVSTPGAPALSENGQVTSYRELEQKVAQVALWMAAQGVSRGDLVALDLERSSGFVVALLAAWRLGAGYLPLDPHWPAGRRQAIIGDAAPVLTVDEPALASAIASAADVRPIPVSAPAAAAGDIAYVLYTSGSTGMPKGVLIEQAQLLNYVAGASHTMALAGSRRWALTGTVAADLGNTALFGALFNGACLVIASAADMQDAPSFARFLGENAIDAIKMVPSHLEALLDLLDGDAPALPQRVILGGEAAPAALLARLLALRPDCRIYNHYGPTETTIGVMIHALDGSAPVAGVLPLSVALPNCRIEVRDAQLRPVAAGAQGELYIGGAQLARGYLNRDDGAVFIDDPQQPGQRLYRSGDLAWLLPGGGLLLAGRADHQLKIRGYRVEPAEIEAALLGAPGVRQAVVLAVTEQGVAGVPVQPTLVAVVVPETTGAAGEAVLREHLAAQLPAHMLPGRYTLVDTLPRLANGKIDRAALAAALPLQQGRQKVAVAPRDALEFVLAGCMAELLVRDEISVDDDFFDLGGHSLLVIKLTARIRKLLKIEIAPGLVFDHASVEALARLLRANSTDAGQLERLAEAQRKLALMSPEQRAALLERGRQGKAA
ncbi:MAG: amino acid adenylation domain-containing protein [Duganella sp.]